MERHRSVVPNPSVRDTSPMEAEPSFQHVRLCLAEVQARQQINATGSLRERLPHQRPSRHVRVCDRKTDLRGTPQCLDEIEPARRADNGGRCILITGADGYSRGQARECRALLVRRRVASVIWTRAQLGIPEGALLTYPDERADGKPWRPRSSAAAPDAIDSLGEAVRTAPSGVRQAPKGGKAPLRLKSSRLISASRPGTS